MAVNFAVVQAAAAASGNQDFTKTGFGTPKAAIFIVTRADTNGSFDNHAMISLGFTDGTRHRVQHVRDENASTNTDSLHRGATDEVIQMFQPTSSTIEAEANFSSFGVDKVTITWGNTTSLAYLVTVILINGAEFDGQFVGDFTSNASAEGTTVVDFGVGNRFRSDVIMFISHEHSFGDSNALDGDFGFGFAARDPADDSVAINNSVNYFSDWNDANGDPQVFVSSDRCIYNHDNGTGKGSVEITTIGTDGFTATTKTAGSIVVGYLAMKFGGEQFKVWDFDTPTGTGNSTDGGPGFTPDFVMYGMSQSGTRDASIVNNLAGSFGFSTFTADDAFSNVICVEDAAVNTNTASICDNKPVNLADDDQTAGPSATFTSMAATGPELNWTAPKAMKWIGWGVGASAAFVPYPKPRGLDGGAIAMSGGLQ